MKFHPIVSSSLMLALIAGPSLAAAALAAGTALAVTQEDLLSAETFVGLKLRSIGPALMAGRVVDFAVNPHDRANYFVAAGSGGVWKTTNAGTTWTSVFDSEGSYSIGCVAMDPSNPAVVWVGTGENNSQRSVGFGNGVYRTRDGGMHWENMGLSQSEHIGMILIDHRDSSTVYVAAQGPLWRGGGDRGLYKTIDGGASWERILHISDDTGVNEVHMDPRDPDVLYASAYQRRRHVWTLIDGGPESAIYKSIDAGVTWRKLTDGLPETDMGRIGLGVAPGDPDIVYAIIEAADKKGGFFRSTDRGETWEKRNDYMTTSPQYYNEIVCDPINADRVYALDTFLHVTEDGGKTFQRVPRRFRHVDDHALWIDPNDTDHLLVGCDGGVYESYDRGENWDFKPNLPVTQFYRISVDDSEPFYYVYGGTQDNNTLGAPSRTRDRIGIANEHWFVTVGGDGYKTQVDPEDPNIVYSQWQYGGLVRHDRRSGEIVDIKPREAPSEEPFRWNWDSPFIISPHNHRRLYFAGNKLFRSDDGGNSWAVVSGDLTRRLDRNALKVMGKIQSADVVAKHNDTSVFGNSVALTESPLVEGLIYVGTDDGLVQVTENGGQTWRRIALFPGVPDMTYVSCLLASRHNEDAVYAAFDNHKNGDFKPYILTSCDRGQTWTSIVGDLPERDIVLAMAEDHVKANLLFVGTEFGAYFTGDGGGRWIRLKGGIPTISIRDIAVQRRENDLVLGSFGRGVYILDDYTPLRVVTKELLEREAVLFPVKDALRYIENSRLGGEAGMGSQGASFYAAPNPPFGAVFTFYLKDKITTRKERRQETEKKADKEGTAAPYPTIADLRAEDEEKEPTVLLIVRDESGEVIRRITGPREKGIHRVAWDLRYPASTPTVLEPEKDRPPWWRPPAGPLALPGAYRVTLAKEVDGVITQLAGPEEFNVVPLEVATFAAEDRAEVLRFQKKSARLQRAVCGAVKAAEEAQKRLAYLRKAHLDTPAADPLLLAEIQRLEERFERLLTKLRGDHTRSKRNEPTPPSVNQRIHHVVSAWNATSAPTQTQRDAYRHAEVEFAELLSDLRTLMEADLTDLEKKLEAAGAPWTPGRIPDWEAE
ncbi:MAG: glycosyl hydrolase [Phycisphaerae bacterium]|nr:glycosyl hydrolase [Phycisphaerae bacterium]